MKPDDQDYISRIQGIWATFSQHILDEEEKQLPALEDALQELRSRKGGRGNASVVLAKRFYRIRALAPSRSHPVAGERWPVESMFGVFAALVDRLGDVFRKFPDDGDSGGGGGEKNRRES